MDDANGSFARIIIIRQNVSSDIRSLTFKSNTLTLTYKLVFMMTPVSSCTRQH